MARQDFAHNTAPSAVKSSSNGGSIASVISIICIASACFAAGYWIGMGTTHNTSSKADIDAMQAQLAVKEANIKLLHVKIETLESLVEQWKSKANADAHTKIGELNFYKELPQQSVTPAPVSAKPIAQKPKKINNTHKAATVHLPLSVAKTQKQAASQLSYHLQMASFRRQTDGMPLQQKLLDSGFSAFIQQVDLGDKGIWFRVYAGPFASKSDAEDKQQHIQEQLHLKGLLVRAR